MPQPIRGQGGHHEFTNQPEKKHKLIRGFRYLASCKVLLNSVQRLQRSRKVSANQRLGSHISFPIAPENTNLVEDFELLFPVKFR